MNVNGWFARPRAGLQHHSKSAKATSVQRKHQILRCLRCHNVDLAGLQHTHFKDSAVVRGERWWLQRQGYNMLAPTQAGTARGSSAMVWKIESWSLELSEKISAQLLLALLHHADGGSLRLLVGHMECEPVARRKQWEAIHEKSPHVVGQPLLTLIDHNSIMVPGVDSVDIPKELPETVKVRERESWRWRSGLWAMCGCICMGNIEMIR